MQEKTAWCFTVHIRHAYENYIAFDLIIKSEEIKQTIRRAAFLLFLNTGTHNSVYIFCQINNFQEGISVYKICNQKKR